MTMWRDVPSTSIYKTVVCTYPRNITFVYTGQFIAFQVQLKVEKHFLLVLNTYYNLSMVQNKFNESGRMDRVNQLSGEINLNTSITSQYLMFLY